MTDKIKIDPNILFRKIKNQFLAATIGICVTIAILISAILYYNLDTTQLIVIVGAFLIIIVLAISSIIWLNKYSPEFLQQQKEEFDIRLVAQQLSQIILSYGETCSEVNVTDNHRGFAADALAVSVENFQEKVSQTDWQLVDLLEEIKNISKNEKSLKEVSEVLKKNR